MLLDAKGEPKFYKYIRDSDSKFSNSLLQSIRLEIGNSVVRSPLVNPFSNKQIPNYTKVQLPTIVLYMAKQMQQTNFRNLGLIYLDPFLSKYQNQLVEILSTRKLHCDVFSLSVTRYLQQNIKANELTMLTQKIKASIITDVLLSVLEKINATEKIKKKEIGNVDKKNHSILLKALVGYASAKYIKQTSEDEFQDQYYIEKAVRISSLCMEHAEHEEEFGPVREFVHLTSHLLIFNNYHLKPVNLYEFCFNNFMSVSMTEDHHNQIIGTQYEKQFFFQVRLFIKLDPQYLSTIVSMVRVLLKSQIKSQMLITHFQVLILIIQEKIFTDLKKKIYTILLENTDRKIQEFIDKIYEDLLVTDPDLTNAQTQCYNLQLAELGTESRKLKFVEVYYYSFIKNKRKLGKDTINFIFEIYIEGKIHLTEFQYFLSKEATNINSQSMKKLHAIIQEQRQQTHINLLEIILQKRIESVVKRAKQYIQAHPFVNKEWLEAAGCCPTIYELYLKIIIDIVGGKTVETKPQLINLNSCILKFDRSFFSVGIGYYKTLLEQATKEQIFSPKMFIYMIVCQAIFGQSLEKSSYLYFHKFFKEMTKQDQLNSLIFLLEYLVRVLKNRSAVILYLQSIIEFQKHLPDFTSKKIFQIQFLASLVQDSKYFQLATYSIQSLTLLLELSMLIEEQSFQQNFKKILIKWSGQLGLAQANNFCYLFCFRQIKKIFPYIYEKPQKNNKQRIARLAILILELLDIDQQPQQYLETLNNRLCVDWKSEQILKEQLKSVKMEVELIRNINMNVSFDVSIVTFHKTYSIQINNERCFIFARPNDGSSDSKQIIKEQPLKDLKKRPEVIQVVINLEGLPKNKNPQFHLVFVVMGQPIELIEDGSLQTLSFSCQAGSFLKNLAITNLTLGQTLKKPKQHLTVMKATQVRIKSLKRIKLESFINKFDFERIFCIWGEMLKYFKYCIPIDGYRMFIRFSFRLFRYLESLQPHRKTPHELLVMRAAFSLLEKAFHSLKARAELTIEIELKQPEKYAYYLYYLYVSAFLPKNYWYLLSSQTQKDIVKLLGQILHNPEFNELENQNFQLFEKLCQIVDQRSEIIQILDSIILTHQINSFLSIKFEHYLCLSPEKRNIAERLPQMLENLVACISSENQQNLKYKILCKFLITQTNSLDVIFMFCPIKAKISLIHYIIYSTTKANKIRQFVSMMKHQQKAQLMGLLIIQLQQDSVPRLIKKKLSGRQSVGKTAIFDKNQETMHTQLYLLAKLWPDATEQMLVDAIQVLKSFLQARYNQIDFEDSLFKRVQNTICTENYCTFLYCLKDKRKDREHHREEFQALFDLSFKIISQSSKNKFLVFMSNYLKIIPGNLELCLYPLVNHNMERIPLCNQAIVFQYVYEVLILMERQFIFPESEKQTIIDKIIHYVEQFIMNIGYKQQISKPLIYVFPKLMGSKEIQTTQKVARKFKKVQNLSFLELKGGIYFKLVLIVMELINTRVNTDFTKILDRLLFKKSDRRSSMSKKSSSNTEIIPKSEKTSFERYLNDYESEHKKYYMSKQQLKGFSMIEIENDLSSSLYQYLLMKLCQYLQDNADIIDESILESYSKIILEEIQHPRVSSCIQQFNKNIYSDILTYEEIQHSVGNISLSPQGTPRKNAQMWSPNLTPSPNKQGDRFRQTALNSNQFFITPVAMSPVRLGRRQSGEKLADNKVRTEIIDQLTYDPRQWGTLAKKHNFSTFFSSKCKQIKLKELMHIHYLLNRNQICEVSVKFVHKAQLKKLVDKHFKTCKLLSHKVDTSILEYSLRKIKKIYPYTSPSRTVLKVMENCLLNMSCPIIQHVSCKEYSVRKLRHQESLNVRHYEEDHLSEDNFDIDAPEQNQIHEEPSQLEICEDQFTESLAHIKMVKQLCQFVTREGVYFCQWELTQRELRLKPKDNRPSYTDNKIFITGTPDQNLIKKNLIQHTIDLGEISQIFGRKFSQRNNSIEIFMNNGTSRFICFYNKTLLGSFMKNLTQTYSGLSYIKDPPKDFFHFGFTEKWINGTLSNFDYLMLLNKYSGRTLCDVNQYYIFPWILKDYQSSKIDLTDGQIYRDLSKPIGALNPEKLKRFKDLYKGNGGSHFYGSHYSTSLFILYYLVRVEPFTTLHREMQKGFDIADRLFSSIYQVWDTLMSQSSTSDIKQLIPQFFYMPAFLKNVGNIEFGQKMCGEDVNDVVLPPWCSSAEEFTLTLRAALESDFVSENLHLWIDLIFGKHQCSEEKFNVFLPQTYEQKLNQVWSDMLKNPRQLKGKIDQITYFGQCPSRLFNKEHRPKNMNPDHSQTHKSAIKKPLSHTTTSLAIHEQVSILPNWKINKVTHDNFKFHIEFESITEKKEVAEAVIESSAGYEDIKLSLEDLKPPNKSKIQSSKIKQPAEKIKLTKTELRIGKQVIMNLEMNFSFEQVQLNDMWIVCYGQQGLRVYNWLQEPFWSWNKGQVTFVHLEPTRMIFSTPTGKVCFYSLFSGKFQSVEVIKECSSLEITVMAIPRLPSRLSKNTVEYRLLCVGDGKRVTIVSHLFDQSQNKTSREKTH